MDTRIIRAVKIGTSIEFDLEVQINEDDKTGAFCITVRSPEINTSQNGEYYFETFQKLRDKLLILGIGLRCMGAMQNVCQSPMAAYTEKIYIMSLGKQALMKDLVSIFDYTDIRSFATTDEQNRFYQQWIKSLSK